jgi:bifunctional non-homologous end joining protein LigD
MESITLYYREGPSDKVYQASLQPKDSGHVVNFAYGRRGSTFSTGTKTQSPVDYRQAKSIYDKLIKEKVAKGYKPGTDSPQYQNDIESKQHSGIQCQLLNPVTEDHVEDLIHDREFWMQEKKDGRRLIIKKEGANITGINRLGLNVALPQSIVESAANYRGDFMIDGEAIGDTLHAFDLLFMGGEDIRTERYAERYLHLMNVLASFQHRHIELVETHFRPAEKQSQFHHFKEAGREGVVFKHIDAPYTPGRPNAGGTQFKHKFYETASFIVTKLNVQRSVSLILFDGAKVVNAGNVTIPPNTNIPTAGSVIECRYLYAFKESGSIYQPVYLGTRTDIRGDECTTAQLKYKNAEAQAAA